jgi:hypothetical protein
MESYIDEARVLEHLGHDLTVAVYGDVNVAIECLDCFEIVWDNGQ